MKVSAQYVSAFLLVVGLIVFLHHASRAEDPPARTGFVSFPLELTDGQPTGASWIGRDVGLDDEILAVLKVDDFMMRVYLPVLPVGPMPAGSRSQTPVWLYTGYYQTQRTGVTYHSPLNCLPGSGWNILSREVVSVPLGGPESGAALAVNKVLIQKGLEAQLILYWYQDRGRPVTNEYWAKLYLLWDAMTRNRTDGALVRISVPIPSTIGDQQGLDEAFHRARQFLRAAYPHLLAHLPA